MLNRKKDIMEAGVTLALRDGFRNVTRDGVATEARVSTALVNRYWGTIENLRDAIVLEAVRKELLPILAQAMLDGHPYAVAAPKRVQERAARHILHG